MSTTESTRNATTAEAASLARSLMNANGLGQWAFEFDRAARRFGRCSHRRQTITLSEPLVVLNTLNQARDTILHEIAHALLGPGQGHGDEWKAMARKLGANPERCFDEAVVRPKAPWRQVCPNCGRSAPRHRRTTRRPACAFCCKEHNGGKYTDKYLLRLERNK